MSSVSPKLLRTPYQNYPMSSVPPNSYKHRSHDTNSRSLNTIDIYAGLIEKVPKMSRNTMDIINTAWSDWLPIDLGSPYTSRSNLAVLILGIFTCYFIACILGSLSFGVDAPIVGYRSFFEPTWLVRLRFVLGGRAMIQTGYERVSNNIQTLTTGILISE